MSGSEPESTSVLAGRNAVREALECGAPTLGRLLVRSGLDSPPIRALVRDARKKGIVVQFVPEARLQRVAAGLNHQGVVAFATQIEYLELERLLSGIAADPDEVRSQRPVVLVLDRIEDSGNLGAILRSAAAAGVAGVVLPDRHAAQVNDRAIRTSSGWATRLPIARTSDLADALEQMKERGYWVVGAAGDGERTIWEADWARPLAVVIGNEQRGLRERVREKCDELLRIPLERGVDSLNASVAAALLLFAAARERARPTSEP